MHLVNEFVEVILVPGTEIDEALHRLVWVSRDVLTLSLLDNGDGIVGEGREIRDTAVHVGGFVNADKRFVKDSEEVTEKLERGRFLDHGGHHGFIALACQELQKLFEVSI